MKHRVRLTETDIHRIIKETLSRILNEGAYGYPDRIDMLILYAENDREIADMLEWVKNAVAKEYKRGEEITTERLVNSFIMKKIQQLAVKKFIAQEIDYYEGEQQTFLTNEDKYNFRKFFADRIIDKVKNNW